MELVDYFGSLMVGTIGVAGVVFGVAQAFKTWFGWDGRKAQILAFAIGLVGVLLIEGRAFFLLGDLAPVDIYDLVISVLFKGLVGALTASGFYKFQTRNDAQG